MASIDELRSRAATFMARPTAEPAALAAAPPRFSPFRIEDQIRARELAERFISLAGAHEVDTGLEAVLDEAERAAEADGLDLAKFALFTFSLHDRRGRRLPLESLEHRAPQKVLPSAGPAAAAGDPEAELNWYREDPKANEHHEHWHAVYPTAGLPGIVPPRAKDRQGELFFYMHRQMLARYDTERIAVGLERVTPLTDYGSAIAEAYDPTPLNPVFDVGYSARPAGLTMADLERADLVRPGDPPLRYRVDQHRTILDRILDVTEADTVDVGGGGTRPVDADLLGDIEEPSVDSPDRRFYGNHHGMGHLLLACINDPRGTAPPGVMIDTATAIRDPVFYRWHKHVDNIAARLEARQAPHDFSDGPDVLLRKGEGAAGSPDIILCFTDAIPGGDDPDFAGAAFGEAAFGGEAWSAPADGDPATDEFQTMMLQRPLRLRDGGTVDITYLDQRPFAYFLRVENRADRDQDVTVRISRCRYWPMARLSGGSRERVVRQIPVLNPATESRRRPADGEGRAGA